MHHNKLGFSQIKQLYFDENYSKFLNEAEQYLYYNKNCIEIRFMRALVNRKLEKFELVINDLKYILEIDKTNKYAVNLLFFTYYYTNNYSEALKIFPLAIKLKCISIEDSYTADLIISKNLGVEIPEYLKNSNDYRIKQILDYSESAAMEHIEKRHSLDLGEQNLTESYFNSDINLNELYNAVRASIKNSKKSNINDVLERHYFIVRNVGFFKDSTCNFLKVILEPQTNNIINMYPVAEIDYKYATILDCDYSSIYSKDKVKTKTLSQIEKFKSKYKV